MTKSQSTRLLGYLALCNCIMVQSTVHAATQSGLATGTPDNIDTGIRADQCYMTGSDALTDCQSTDIPGQDGQLGRDTYSSTNSAGDGELGFSLIYICNSGWPAGEGTCPTQPVIGPGPDELGCVSDNLTGVMWEVKTRTGFSANNLKYTNYSAEYDPVGQFRSSTDATGYVDRVNAAGMCGFYDWGLSHTVKVQSIINYGIDAQGAVRVAAAFFPTTKANWYWNASPNPSSVSAAFAVNFLDGRVSNAADRSTQRHVQLLRNAKDTVGPNGRYEFSEDGSEVRDTSGHAELRWRRCVEGIAWDGDTCAGTALQFTHEQALLHAAQQAGATGLPWRVPSVKEQNYLVQRVIPSPTIVHKAFPNTPPDAFWTSTPEVRQARRAWTVDFRVGLVAQRPRAELHYLRLARDPDDLGP